MYRVWLGLIVGLAAHCLAGEAAAASIRGRIKGQEHLRNPVWLAAKSAEGHGYSFREPVPMVPSSLRKLFPDVTREVCIVAFAMDKSPKRKKSVSVRVAGGRTSQVTLVVQPGTELKFTNGDAFAHQLYGVGISSFTPAPLAPGKSRRWPAKEAGRYEVADESSPSVRMWIVAKPGVAAVAYPSANGSFLLNLEKPGDYTLQAYFAGRAVGKPRRVKVGRRKVNLSRRPLVLAKKAPREAGGKK